MSLTYVKAVCHCGQNEFQIPFSASTLPQEANICHCGICRHTTGQMFTYGAIMDGVPLASDTGFSLDTHKPADLSTLGLYKATEKCRRYFCPRCFAYILFNATMQGNSVWGVASGSLERTEGVVKIGSHVFVGDTYDGGLTTQISTLNGRELKRYEGWSSCSKLLEPEWKSESLASCEADTKDTLHLHCHCKSISLYLTRPSKEEGEDPVNWLVVPKEGDQFSKPRYRAAHCFCTPCRLMTGSLFVTNLIVLRKNLFDAHTDLPISLSTPDDGSVNLNRPRGLVQYEREPGGFRECCGTCGAGVFYWMKKPDEEEKIHVSVNMGSIDAKQCGSRAESWFSWYPEIIHGEQTSDKDLAAAIQAAVSTSG